MFPPAMAYTIARIQHAEDVRRAEGRRRSRQAGAPRKRPGRRADLG